MEAIQSQIIFLKLGGSLITDKNTPMTANRAVINRLAGEIAASRRANPALRLVIGHGSGSFGHVAAHKYATYQGSRTAQEWLGFAEVWQAARMLNQIVLESLYAAGLPVIAFPPSAGMITDRRKVIRNNFEPLQKAITNGLIPVVNGDVVFDRDQGSTILSTEEVFCYLAPLLHPVRILLAGLEPGVWADFPACTHLAPLITRSNLAQVAPGLSGSAAVDVTGGMAQKVSTMLSLTSEVPNLEVLIFSGSQPGLLQKALEGAAAAGTLLKA
jgi:isopentenyl phosphate kinase